MRQARALVIAIAGALAVSCTGRGAEPASTDEQAATHFADVNGLRLAYEVRGPSDGQTILLIAGTDMQLTGWPPELVDALVQRGFRVVAFDNRDVGLSSGLDSLGAPDWPAIVQAGEEGRPLPLPYSLEDLAEDAAGLLTAVGADRAHVVGVSQGGIVAQMLAIRHPERVRSLTIMMAGSGNPIHPMPADPERLSAVSAGPADTTMAALIDHQVAIGKALAGSGYPPDEEKLRADAERSLRRAYHPAGVARQQAAALAATYQDRRQALQAVRVPTVVIQGGDDPLVPVESVREVAESIPDARFLLIPGMGHDLPPEAMDEVVGAIASVAERAG